LVGAEIDADDLTNDQLNISTICLLLSRESLNMMR
jgi:hypothetical protein